MKEKTQILTPTESQEASLLFDLIACAKPKEKSILTEYLAHWPNEGKRSYAHGKILKKQGLKKGISDYFLAYPVRNYYGMWLELKRIDKKLSRVTKEQILWLEKMKYQGYHGVIAYGADQAFWFLCDYLS